MSNDPNLEAAANSQPQPETGAAQEWNGYAQQPEQPQQWNGGYQPQQPEQQWNQQNYGGQ